jgi:hypothetical protein
VGQRATLEELERHERRVVGVIPRQVVDVPLRRHLRATTNAGTPTVEPRRGFLTSARGSAAAGMVMGIGEAEGRESPNERGEGLRLRTWTTPSSASRRRTSRLSRRRRWSTRCRPPRATRVPPPPSWPAPLPSPHPARLPPPRPAPALPLADPHRRGPPRHHRLPLGSSIIEFLSFCVDINISLRVYKKIIWTRYRIIRRSWV